MIYRSGNFSRIVCDVNISTRPDIIHINKDSPVCGRERMWRMAYEEKYKAAELPHNVIMEGRKKVSVSGVDDVESFDENEIIMSTSPGRPDRAGQGAPD